MKRFLLAGLLALAVLLIRTPTAQARGLADDKVVVGESYTLPAGQTLDGNLVVLGGNVTIEDGAEVTGHVVVLGGNVELAGRVGQDLVTFGGNANLASTAVVAGRLVTSGGSITRAEGAEVRGGETQSAAPEMDWTPSAPAAPGPLDLFVTFLWNGVRAVALAIVLGLLGLLTALLLPEPLSRVSGAIANAPLMAGGLGLLTLVAVPVLAAVLALVTLLCLSPVSLLALMAYSVAILFGWLALGALLGERLAAALRWRGLSAVLAAGLGAFLISLVTGGIGLLPFLGGLLSGLTQLVLAAIGLGAVTLTRFGARPYTAGGPPTVMAPPPPPPAEGPAGDPAI